MSSAPQPESRPPSSPIIILTYAFSGADYLREVLSTATDFASTYSTGVLPLCDAAAATWRRIDGSDTGLSALAMRSIRSLSSQLIAIIMAGSGGTRWCETVIAPPDCAELFTRLYPATKLISFHRSFADFVQVAIGEYPWGLADSPFAAFTAAYPNRSAAAISAYWASYTERLIEFERTHADRCLRLRFEDLTADPSAALKRVLAFIDDQPEERELISSAIVGGRPYGDADAHPSRSRAQVPVNEIPPALLQRIRKSCAALGYQPALDNS
jgi:protein-tyrosine sulfotransferase